VALAIRLEGLAGIGSSYLTPGVSNVVANVVAAAANGRTENDVNVVDTRAKGGGHHRNRCTNDIRDGPSPPGVGNSDGRAATPGAGIDDQHRLAVGMQGHQHRTNLVRDQRIAEPDLSRTRRGAMSSVPLCGDADIPAVNLTQRHEVLRYEAHCGTPTLAHRPGVFPITGRTEPNVAIGAA
jgi:hypothetical protein